MQLNHSMIFSLNLLTRNRISSLQCCSSALNGAIGHSSCIKVAVAAAPLCTSAVTNSRNVQMVALLLLLLSQAAALALWVALDNGRLPKRNDYTLTWGYALHCSNGSLPLLIWNPAGQ